VNRRSVIVAFVVLAAAQLAAAVSIIVRYERTLSSGSVYKLRVQPIDPADPFRGRYVAIAPRLVAPVPSTAAERDLLEGSRHTVHAVLERDEDGFARIVRVQAEPPAAGDWLQAHPSFAVYEQGRRAEGGPPRVVGYALAVPFDRYYMKETLAPQAEVAYREAAGRDDAWIVLRVRKGMGAIDALYVGGEPIEEVAGNRAAEAGR
jgi:uncharacterized membrane-anchored protein